MRSVVWSAEAERDYLNVLAWIAEDNPFAAERISREIRKAGNDFGDFATGKPGRVAGTYEKALRRFPYIIAYRITGVAEVSILRVIHTARDWPSGEWPR